MRCILVEKQSLITYAIDSYADINEFTGRYSVN
jgi:hypothetical protein